jgi:hypothetical protein
MKNELFIKEKKEVPKNEIRKANPFECYHDKRVERFLELFNELYINIVKETEHPQDVLVTLSSLLTQILLFANNVEDRQMFLRHSRADEIAHVLTSYFKDFDLTKCIKLIKLFKADIKALESIK